MKTLLIVMLVALSAVKAVDAEPSEMQKAQDARVRQYRQRAQEQKLTAEDIVAKKVAHAKAAKEYERRDTKSPPLQLDSSFTSWNVIGEREFALQVRNVSMDVVVAYEGTIACFNRFGDPVKGFLDNSNVVGMICQNHILPGEKDTSRWTLRFRDTAAVKRVRITRVKLDDGRIWTSSPSNEIYAVYEDQ